MRSNYIQQRKKVNDCSGQRNGSLDREHGVAVAVPMGLLCGKFLPSQGQPRHKVRSRLFPIVLLALIFINTSPALAGVKSGTAITATSAGFEEQPCAGLLQRVREFRIREGVNSQGLSYTFSVRPGVRSEGQKYSFRIVNGVGSIGTDDRFSIRKGVSSRGQKYSFHIERGVESSAYGRVFRVEPGVGSEGSKYNFSIHPGYKSEGTSYNFRFRPGVNSRSEFD